MKHPFIVIDEWSGIAVCIAFVVLCCCVSYVIGCLHGSRKAENDFLNNSFR